MCTEGSSTVIYEMDRLKNRGSEIRIEESYKDLSYARGFQFAGMSPAQKHVTVMQQYYILPSLRALNQRNRRQSLAT